MLRRECSQSILKESLTNPLPTIELQLGKLPIGRQPRLVHSSIRFGGFRV